MLLPDLPCCRRMPSATQPAEKFGLRRLFPFGAQREAGCEDVFHGRGGSCRHPVTFLILPWKWTRLASYGNRPCSCPRV